MTEVYEVSRPLIHCHNNMFLTILDPSDDKLYNFWHYIKQKNKTVHRVETHNLSNQLCPSSNAFVCNDIMYIAVDEHMYLYHVDDIPSLASD